MTIRYPDILDYRFPDIRQSYTAKDCILYALGTGFGTEPENLDLLPFVYEKALKVSPTIASVLGDDVGWSLDDRLGLTHHGLLHGEEHLVFHAPIPAAGTLHCTTRFSEVFDLGPTRGALLVMDKQLKCATGTLLADIRRIEFARADGGFGGPAKGAGRIDLPAPAVMPARAPDHLLRLEVPPMTPLIYRLNGDYVALHVDPSAAKRAGFERPILHGLSTMGFCCQGLLRTALGFDATALKTLGLRFAAPVYGGDSLELRVWCDGQRLSFEAYVPERGVMAITNGYASIKEIQS